MYNFTKRNVIKRVCAMTRFTSIVVTTILSLTGILRAEHVSSQSLKASVVSLNFKRDSLETIFNAIERQTEFRFTHTEEIKKLKPVHIKVSKMTLYEVLNQLTDGGVLSFNQVGRMIRVHITGPPGKITGKILDEKGEGLPGASLKVLETGNTIQSNVDGTYSLTVKPGNYTLEISYVSYQTQRVTGVVVNEGQQLNLNITLKPASKGLKEVVVTSDYRQASIEGLYARQKNNAVITDGISAEQIARTPDKNLGETLKRISGLSTVDNKYVVVRGLGERYNGAVLNGQMMPSTEINRKNFSYDIIPSNLVENVTVSKGITPDMSAEFGGGLVQVNTKTVPTENFTSFNIGASYNEKTTWKDFRALKISGSEYFGQVGKDRELFGTLDWKSKADIFNTGNFKPANVADKFSNNWVLHNYRPGPSPNAQFSIGRVVPLKNGQQFGFSGALSYRNTFQTQEVRMSRDGFLAVMDNPEKFGFQGNKYGFNVNIGALAAFGYTAPKHKLSLQNTYVRTLDQQFVLGTSLREDDSPLGGGTDYGDAGYYDITTQTVLLQNLLKGEHSIGERGLKFNWSASYTNLDRQRPDNHNMQFIQQRGNREDRLDRTTDFSVGYFGSKTTLRNWNRTYENTFNVSGDLSFPFNLSLGKSVLSSTFKTGYAGWYKKRQFWVLNVGENAGGGSIGNDFLPLSEKLDPVKNSMVSMSAVPFGDDFNKGPKLHATYAMMDNKIGQLRLVWGVRWEYYNMNDVNNIIADFAKMQKLGDDVTDYSVLLEGEPNYNFFPSASLTYSLTPKTNLRLSYSKSIIRPDLRELSYFKEFDFELGGTYISQSPVRSTKIQNYDFRYEWYPGAGEIVSFSFFYKKLAYPMEIFDYPNREFQLRNSKEAINKGVEIDFRKSFAFTGIPVIRNITLFGNFTRLFSTVTPMTIKYVAANDNRAKLVVGEYFGEKQNRPQAGASNYTGNAGLSFETKRFSVSTSYNYVGNRTYQVNEYYTASLFERPLNSLDAQISVPLLKRKAELKFNISNLLNASSLIYQNQYPFNGGYDSFPNGDEHNSATTKELMYDKGQDIINFESSPGRTFSFSLNYKF